MLVAEITELTGNEGNVVAKGCREHGYDVHRKEGTQLGHVHVSGDVWYFTPRQGCEQFWASDIGGISEIMTMLVRELWRR